MNARRDKARAKHLKEVSVFIDEYKNAFGIIYKSYGEKSPEELLDMLKKKEGDNFTTYQCKCSRIFEIRNSNNRSMGLKVVVFDNHLNPTYNLFSSYH